MENLTITKEKVLEAASKCSTANATLRVLFPEAFELDEITLTPYIGQTIRDHNDGNVVWVSNGNIAKKQGFNKQGMVLGLSDKFIWKLGKGDSYDTQILIPTRK